MVGLQPVDAVEVILVVDNILAAGAVFEPLIEPTVAAFADFGVERLVLGHCTGWKGRRRLAQAMPDAFVQPSVGTTLRF
jgi:7,8-dihydropterin-6-yl-methyl-4-(beta-D-ribofuranosyl)aminobenzene 5'-phosphate synthase